MRKNPLENDFELELCRLGDYHADDASGQESRRRPPISATLRESVPREEALLSHAFEHEVADGSALAAEPSGAGVAQVSGRMCERVEAVPLGAGEAGVGAGVLAIGLAARVGDEPGGPLVAAAVVQVDECLEAEAVAVDAAEPAALRHFLSLGPVERFKLFHSALL